MCSVAKVRTTQWLMTSSDMNLYGPEPLDSSSQYFFILLPICQFCKMPSSLCCVLNCNSGKGTIKHRFPRDDALFKLWVDRTGNENLESYTKERILKSCCICTLHFHESCNSPGHKHNHKITKSFILKKYSRFFQLLEMDTMNSGIPKIVVPLKLIHETNIASSKNSNGEHKN
ncbi:THAP domain-containing protein 6-like [Aphis craccivora]|uniref:THAP domain-containing protein 6-like n=1 Tax=Aphis craccivora TaxID=307492 RepID=A0A6G0YAN9_APHCR|nr:THAP domain-containing protein 6-like [Aphis craccivora]